MLVQQPTDTRVNSARQPQDGGLNVTSSVKLRRKNRDSSAEAIKKRNRYSGGDFRIGSPARGSQVNATQQPLRGQEVMRKSGDWSYVSFPNSKSPPLTPKMTPKRPLSMLPQTSVSNFPPKTGNLAGNLNQHLHQHQPISLLESKVMASIIHNEATRSQKASPAVTPKLPRQKLNQPQTPKMSSRSRSNLDEDEVMTSSSAEEYTKALRRRMISEVLQKSNHDIWQIQQLPNSTKSSQPKPVAATTQPKQLTSGLTGSKQTASSRMSRPSEVKRSSASSRIDQRRSQSAQGKRSSNGGPPGSSAASNVETSQSSNKNKAVVPNNCRPGLGRRSVTQLELSRRKRPDEDMAPLRQSKWHSQEHLDQMSTTASHLVDESYHPGGSGGGGVGGNFAGGRKELAMRLLSNCQEEEPSLDTTEEDEQPFQRQNMVSLISGLNEEAVLNNGNNNSAGSQLKKGILWQQRDKIFSRWKERFFVLTNDYLQCFKKGSSRITEMGGFIYGLRLSEILEVQLLDKRGYLTICLSLAAKDGKLFLRKPEGIREWYHTLKTSTLTSKERKNMQSTEEFWSRKQFAEGSTNNIEHWLVARQRIGLQYNYVSPPSTWEREDHEPKSLQIEGGGGRRCRTPKSAPNSRPPSTTRSTASRGGPTSRRSSSQHPNRKYILGISFYS